VVEQFLRYVLSPLGQADVRQAGGYLPLALRARDHELASLRQAIEVGAR
jgi:hypothetical protein